MVDDVVGDFRDKHEPPMNNDIKFFGRFIGKVRVFDDLNIEVIEARNASNRIVYYFKCPGSKRIQDIITRDAIGKKINKLARKDNK